jgi:hypothetical protein
MHRVKDVLIIRDEHGEIVGAQAENPTDNNMSTFISPAKPEHTLHRVSDVPAEVFNLADPVKFHRAITHHVNSGRAKVTKTSADELHSAFSRVLAFQAKDILIIRDEHGEILGAQVENPADNNMSTFISPAKPEHTLHRVSDVPAEIFDLADPVEFHRAITRHVRSDRAKIAKTSADELHSAVSRVLASRGKEGAQ